MAIDRIAEVAVAATLAFTHPEAPPVNSSVIPDHHIQMISAQQARDHIAAPNVFIGQFNLTQPEATEPIPDDLDSLLDPQFRPISLVPMGLVDYGLESGMLSIGITKSGWHIDVVNYFTPDGRNYSRLASIDLSTGPKNSEVRGEIAKLLSGDAQVDDLVTILAHFSPLARLPDLNFTEGYAFYQGMPERNQSLELLFASNFLPDNKEFSVSIREGRANFVMAQPNLRDSYEPEDDLSNDLPWVIQGGVRERIGDDDPHVQKVQGFFDGLIMPAVGRAKFTYRSMGRNTPIGSLSTSIYGEIGDHLDIHISSFDDDWPGKYWHTFIYPFIYPGARLTSALERLVYTEGSIEDMVDWANEVINMPGEELGRKWYLLTDNSPRRMVMTELDLGGGRQALVQVYYDTNQAFPGDFIKGSPWINIQVADFNSTRR